MTLQTHPSSAFAGFRQALETPNKINTIRESLIGEGVQIPGLNGPNSLVYADYVASGRALTAVEEFVQQSVLPYYSNSHTEASYCGSYISNLRAQAREIIRNACGATNDYAVVFTGSGATSGLNRLVHLLGVPKAVLMATPPLILIGPYEHHSNILPWRESGAEVKEIEESENGGPDLAQLEAQLIKAQGRMIIGAFSAASNVNGIITDTAAVTRLLKQYGAKAVWDFAGAGPYVPINVASSSDCEIDALVISTHKFIGGPGASGVLLVRHDAVKATTPSAPGGGTVKFVSPWNHDYSDCLETKEEAGTPNIIGDIRAALVFIVKDIIGEQFLAQRQKQLYKLAFNSWKDVPQIEILGNSNAREHLPIFSLRIRNRQGGGYVHQQLFTRMLSDIYGIQARGGCACAGPYAHRILGIDQPQSDKIRAAIKQGVEVAKPGWTRLNFSVLLTDSKAKYIIDSVTDLARQSALYSEQYCCDNSRAQFSLKSVA